MPQQIELRNIALQAAQPLVHGVSLTLQRGRVLALVGGSGSGKSLTCAATLGILPAGVRQTAGEILADGKPVSPCALRGIKIATIMQNPRSAFNPLHTMHTHARETCLALGKPADGATLTAAIEAVGLENAARVLKLYPFEMSGGMLQRMMIAMAVLCESPFIIADEPTTALDVTIQAQVLAMMTELKEKLNQNSRNSSKPPSTDGYEKPAPKSLRKKSGKKAGGQTGHKGHSIVLDKPDRIERIYPEHCKNCPHRNSCANLKVNDSCYVVDITVKKESIKYQMLECSCNGIHEVAERPAGMKGSCNSHGEHDFITCP